MLLCWQGFRVSAEQQISAAYLATGSDDLDRIDLEMLREAAVTLFNQYLSDKVSCSLKIDSCLVARGAAWHAARHESFYRWTRTAQNDNTMIITPVAVAAEVMSLLADITGQVKSRF